MYVAEIKTWLNPLLLDDTGFDILFLVPKIAQCIIS